MAMDFPASPSVNDIHQVGSQIWFWNATYWELKSNVTKFLSQDAAPSSPLDGDIWYETDTGKLFIRYDSYWVEIGHGSDGQSFIVSETKPASTTIGDIWYESDTGKTFIYYDSYWVEIGHASDADVSAYALLASPELTGTPLAPTAAADTNTTQIATTAYVQTELGAISSDSITDADANTKIQVEESSDENIIRFDTAGTERMTISAAGVVATTGDLTVGGNATIQSLDMDDIVAGDVIYGSGADTLARLAKGSNDEVLTLASGVPSWAAIPAAASDEIIDADSDTKIQVEESADEDKIRFDTGGTERVVIDSSGLDIKSGDLLVADGSGVLFATPNSSGTITAAGNRFDDYEEGYWTPAMSTNGAGTFTCSGSLGYIKIGKMVWVHGYFNVTAVSATLNGRASITGFPYTSENGSTTIHMLHPVMALNLSTDLNSLAITVEPNTTSAYMYGDLSTAGSYYYNTAEAFSGNESIYLNMHYRANY